MNESIHGHAVMRLIAFAQEPLSRGQLSNKVATEFGHDARFHTCSARNMTLEELLQFLKHRGKLIEVGGVLNVAREDICSHE